MLKHGKNEQAVIQQCIRERSPFPDFIKDAPELEPGLALYYIAFLDLAGDRNGMGGPIMWSSIQKYCEHYNLDEDQTEAMFYHIRRMDVIVSKKEK